MNFLSPDDWQQIWSHLSHLGIAFVLALPVAWDRETSARTAGLRTFPLVAIATCGLTLVAIDVMRNDLQAQARLVQGLVTGIGFIGGGAILKHRGTVEGTATAASIWGTGVIGIAVAYSRYEIAIILTLANFATLQIFTPLKEKLEEEEDEEEPDSRP